MNKEELYKLVSKEIEWLVYYGYRPDREKLNINSEIYEDINSIGHTKRKMPLDQRCTPCIITSNETISKDINLDKLIIDVFPHDKNKNRYTPIEAYLVIFPEEKLAIIEKIKNIREDKGVVGYGFQNLKTII